MGFWDLIVALVIGLIVGLLARFLVPGRDPMGCFGTALLGVVGGFVGGLISRVIWGPPPTGQYVYAPGFLLSLVGAIVLLLLFRMVRRR